MRLLLSRLAVVVALLSLAAAPVAAQSFWLDHDQSELTLEILRPTQEGYDLTFFSFAAFASVAAQVTDGALLVMEVPFSRGKMDFEGARETTMVGNLYVGLQTLPEWETGLRLAGGVRVPTASEDGGTAVGVGIMSSATDRYEAFFADILAVNVLGRYVGELSDRVYLSGRFGGVVDFVTEGGGDTELFLLYGAKSWVESDALGAGVGFSGRYLATESDLAFGDRTLHEVGLWADYGFGSVRPGIRLQLPIGNELTEVVDWVLGLYLRYRIP